MARWILILITLIGFCFYLACGFATGTYDDDDDDDGSSVQDDDDNDDDPDDDDDDSNKIENFIWTTVDGEELVLHDYEGYLILLNVGAGWCAECKAESPILEQNFYQKYKDQDFIIIQTLNGDAAANPPDQEFGQDWRDEFGLTFPVCLDPDNSLQPYWTEQALPFSMIVDRNLVPRDKFHGFEEDFLDALIKSYL